jgi:beta-galactosidase
LFYWTGFDYRGEPTPFAWPAVSSQFGIFDLCGFPKDTYYYLQSWWQNEPVMYMWPHWNWAEDVGKEKTVTVYSNCDQVELFLNKKSLGKKDMPLNGHLEWTVNYEPGKLIADGFINGEKAIAYNLETSEEAYSLNVSADKTITDANNQDVSIVTIQVNDSKNRMVPTANVDLSFEIEGPGKIIGVGNGNPSSHESDKYIESISTYPIKGLRELSVETLVNRPEVASEIDDASWKKAFDDQNKPWDLYEDTLLVVRGNFELPIVKENMTVNLFTKSIVENQNIYVNGNLIAENIKRNDLNQSFQLNHSILKSGKNTYVVTGKRFRMRNQWDEPNTDPGLVQIVEPAQSWKRKTFNGLAQVLVQCTNEPGEIILKAKSDDIIGAEIKIISE